jgi:hypothetical protein
MASLSPISCGHDTVTVGSASVGLTAAAIPDAANAADLHTSADIRLWLDGADPTPSTGMPIPAGETIQLQSRHEIENFRAIAPSAESTLSIIYYDCYVV